MPKIANLIVTNNTKYLDETIDSIKEGDIFIVFDGIQPTKHNHTKLQCNANSPAIAKALGVKSIKECNKYDFIQFLDSDDYLLNINYNFISDEFDVYYTDYFIQNEDFNYVYKEYLISPNFENMKIIPYKIKNPLIRTSVFNSKKIDESLPVFEMADLIYQIGVKKLCHIPECYQTTRIHPMCYHRKISENQRISALKIIQGRLNGKV